ncbi:MAG: tetratricopeptide repeat protein [Myxococcales bacterium]|nr:tetratricopeptide repeat protein [Myxococcales bacterium]
MERLRIGLQLTASAIILGGGIPWCINEHAELCARGEARKRASLVAEQGRAAQARGDVDLAARAYADALALSPKDVELERLHVLALAEQVLENESTVTARNVLRLHRTLESALVSSPNEAVVELALGRVQVYRDLRPEAQKRFEAVIAREPKNARALLYLGDLQFRNEELDNAHTTLRRAVDADAASALARLVLGQVLLARRAFKEAEGFLETAAREMPKNPHVHLALGRALVAVEKWREAEVALVRALALDPELHGAQGPLGDAYLRNGKVEQAMLAYRNAYERSRDLESFKKLGRTYVQLGDFESATAVYNEVKTRAPDDPEPHLVFGLAAQISKRPDLARLAWERCVQLSQDRETDKPTGERCLSLTKALDEPTVQRKRPALPKPRP